MNEPIVTKNLADFDASDKREAGRLLSALGTSNDETKFLEKDAVEVYVNRHSGFVFLSDADCNTAGMNGDKLQDWLSCPECGEEGYFEDVKENHDITKGACRRWQREILQAFGEDADDEEEEDDDGN